MDIKSLDAPRIRKKRIPKSCSACRRSKAKCDGKRPCSRCGDLKKICTFIDPPRQPHELRIEELEQQVATLKERLRAKSLVQSTPIEAGHSLPDQQGVGNTPLQPARRHSIPAAHSSPDVAASAFLIRPSHTQSLTGTTLTSKHSKSHFQIGSVTFPDCLGAGLLSLEQAHHYFSVFFQGCDHYVPVFDPRYDSFESIRARSSLLFDAICVVGCRVVTGTDTQQWHMLDFHVKRTLNCALANPAMGLLETVQALLVRSCYASERSLLVAAATRMATDLNFASSYDETVNRSVASAAQGASSTGLDEDPSVLMRKVRTWLHLFVLGHILHVDAADLPTFKFMGDSRRCRILLKDPAATELDLSLFSQVELNVVRSRIYDSLSGHVGSSDEDTMMDIVREAKIDIALWYDDWERIFEKHRAQAPWLGINLRVQKCWAENMAFCRVVRAFGVENVDFMSPAQKSIVAMAKDALEEHLDIMLEEPRLYMRNLRFAMDFVWAKCSFCYLLLLKLSILLPDTRGRSSRELVEHGNILLTELSAASGGNHSGSRCNTGRQYLQLLQAGIEKFSSLTYEANEVVVGAARDGSLVSAQQAPGFEIQKRRELDSFVPEQFIFEWDFPGLTLFSSSATGVAWLDDILAEALNGGEDLFAWFPSGN
ncbi:hypothetical protein HDV57DRAFT_157780 [Trichoderma longibrachiatum]